MATESFIDNPVVEQRWLNQSIKTFELAKETVIDFSPCVCQIPKIIKETKPQAYVPQNIGLGPYHCFRPEFFVNERHKLTIAKNRMDLTKVQHFVNEKLKLIEPVIRAQYDKFLEIDTNTLCWILTIDSLYLLHLLTSYAPCQQVDPERRILAQDIIMLENQIPSIVLIEIQIALRQLHTTLFEKLFFNFCKAHSPLQLVEKKRFRSFNFCQANIPHLLAYMHHLIVNNRAIINEDEEEPEDDFKIMPQCRMTNNVVKIVNIAVGLGMPGANIIAKPISLMSELPWDQITGLVKNKDVENKPLIEEIEIPSVTELEEIAKIKFKLIVGGGIRDIKVAQEKEGERVFYLPEITINSDTEVILRNLVAYEAATAGPDSALELAEYVDFMCGIVDTPKDVDILKKAKIIKAGSTLNDEEIADLFNGITKTTGKFKKKKSDLELAIETVNEKFDNKLRVKAHRFIKKHVYKSWKFLSLLSTIVLIVFLSFQAFCQVYGCSNRWFHTPTPN